jgi:hypothetical protein
MSVTVRQIRKLGNSVSVLVEHPDGGVLCIPETDTSLELTKPQIEINGQTPLLNPTNLLRLAELIATHPSVATQAKSEVLQHPLYVDVQNLNEEVAPTAPSPTHRTGRTHQAFHQADSKIGRQDARPTKTRACRSSKESNK